MGFLQQHAADDCPKPTVQCHGMAKLHPSAIDCQIPQLSGIEPHQHTPGGCPECVPASAAVSAVQDVLTVIMPGQAAIHDPIASDEDYARSQANMFGTCPPCSARVHVRHNVCQPDITAATSSYVLSC